MQDRRLDTLASPRALGRFLLLGLGVWLHAADTLVTATLAPDIVADLDGVAYVNWTISLYEVGAIVAGAATGLWCVRFGNRRVFMLGTVVYGGGCALGALAPNMAVLLGARLVQGMAGGMLLTLCYIAIESWFAQTLWNRLFGIVAAIWGAGALLGPLIGGAFAGAHAWRGAFWVFAVQAAVLCVLAYAWLPRAAQAHELRALAPGGAWPWQPLLVLTVATLLIATAGATNRLGLGIGGCAVGAILLYIAARLDRTAVSRLLPAQLLDVEHPVGAGLLLVFALSVGTTGFWAYGPLLLKILFGTPSLVTGYILAGEGIAWTLATLAVGSATAAADSALIRGGTLGVVVGAGGFAFAVPSGSFVGMAICGLLQGAGFGLCWPAIVQRIVRYSAPTEQSQASGAASTIQRIGYAVGTAAVGIAANLSGLADGISAATAKTAGFWVFAAFIPVLAIGLVSAWRFTGRNTCPLPEPG
jgi:MFS family permease